MTMEGLLQHMVDLVRLRPERLMLLSVFRSGSSIVAAVVWSLTDLICVRVLTIRVR